MKPHEVTPDNMHLAVALVLERQAGFFEVHQRHTSTLDEIKTQVIRTNGQVTLHAQEIGTLKSRMAAVSDLHANGCPQMHDLSERTRAIEDAALLNRGQREGMGMAGKAAWALLGTVITTALVWLFRQVS